MTCIKDFKKSIVVGLAAGFLSAMVSTLPGGQIPNVIDKLFTAIIIYGVINILNKEINTIKMVAIQIIGTFISGTIFLTSASLVAGFDPNAIIPAMMTVVATAAIGNVMIGIVVYKAFVVAQRSLQYN